VIKAVLNLVRRGSPKAKGLDIFSGLLLGSASEAQLAPFADDKLADLTHEAFSFLAVRPHNSHKLQVREADLAQQPAPPSTLVEILSDDLPYLLDSILGEIEARGLGPGVTLRAIFKVHRYGSERLREVFAAGDANWADGYQECYLALLLPPMEPAAARALAETLEDILTEVRRAAADDAAMRTRLTHIISAYEALARTPGERPTETTTTTADLAEATAFVRWLLQEHFIPLGLREYEFVGADDKVDLQPAARGAMGILRDSRIGVLHQDSDGHEARPNLRGFYFGPSLVIVTRASSQSRIYRRRPYDYVGLKNFSPAGRLIGEVRLIGLFVPEAYLQSVRAIPVIRRKVQALLVDPALTNEGHRTRTLIDGLERLPRDELFQIAPDELRVWASAVADLETRPATRVLMRRDEFDRFVSLLVFIPRERYSSAIETRIAAVLAETCRGRVTSNRVLTGDGPHARLQVVVETAGPQPQIARPELELKVDALLRTWSERLGAEIGVRHPPDIRDALLNSYRDGALERARREG
jgi:glutamate dehydrogenase